MSYVKDKTIINEVVSYPREEFSIWRWIPIIVEEYGTDGIHPKDFRDCPLNPKSHEEVSCSGPSTGCVYFADNVAENIIRCTKVDDK